jgi:hypothetical protein
VGDTTPHTHAHASVSGLHMDMPHCRQLLLYSCEAAAGAPPGLPMHASQECCSTKLLQNCAELES